MTVKELKILYPATTHMVNGGNLWYYSAVDKKWYVQTNFIMPKERGTIEIYNIIEDKHFEARKAYALGKEIEVLNGLTSSRTWAIVHGPAWEDNSVYREVSTGKKSKKPKPVHEWLWYYESSTTDGGFRLGTTYYTKDEVTNHAFKKFKPSKRIRKEV